MVHKTCSVQGGVVKEPEYWMYSAVLSGSNWVKFKVYSLPRLLTVSVVALAGIESRKGSKKVLPAKVNIFNISGEQFLR